MDDNETGHSTATDNPVAAAGRLPPFTAALGRGDARDGITDDVGSDVRWMSYAELGQARGISTASATRLAFRRKWRRQVGNDGTARMAVPVTEARRQQDRPHDDTADVMGDARADITHAVTALEGTVATLRERAEAADRRAEQAEKGREAAEIRTERAEQAISEAQNRADRAEASRDQERSRADVLGTQAQEALTRLAAAEAEVKAAHDRAWASGEAQAAAERRAEAERGRADRAESAAAHERQDFLDGESRTRRELETVRKRLDTVKREHEQAEAARRAKGRLARAWRAWRGELACGRPLGGRVGVVNRCQRNGLRRTPGGTTDQCLAGLPARPAR